MQPLTSLALGLEATARVLERYQVDPTAVFAAAGLAPDPYRDADARVPLSTMSRIWKQCAALTRDPCIGFEVGRSITAANLHAVGFAWLASRTLEEALRRLVRHQRMISTAGRICLEPHDGELRLLIEPRKEVAQEGVDAFLAGVIAICRQVAYEDFQPLSVAMVRGRPRCARELARYFACPVKYGSPHNCIAFRSTQVQKFLPRQNPAMAQASDEVAQRYIMNMDRHDVLTRARVGLIELLASGEPTRGALAGHLHMSERTLARRLRDGGSGFRELLDEVRRELGLGYIRQSAYSVTDIAYLLGFSDPSNFARSFRRWTGSSPSAYR
ncbi:MAG: AraC family transcriptional regulator, partial [Anaerolineae bacterium]